MTNKALAWIGVDVSKDCFDVALVEDQPIADLPKLASARFKRTRLGVEGFIHWLADHLRGSMIDCDQIGLVMESTGHYSLELCGYLSEAQQWHTLAIVNPRLVKDFIKSLGLRNKTDRIDAKALAFFGRERTPVSFQPRDPDYQRLRDLTRYRRALLDEKVAQSLRLKVCKDKFITRSLNKQIKAMEKLISNCEKEIRKVIAANQALADDVELICTMTGIGPVTAWTVLGELGDLRRFKRSRQLSAMAGLSPSIKESGSSVRGRTRLSKQGGGELRKVIYMAALAAVRVENSRLSTCYQHLLASGKTKKQALCTIMRKMLVIMRAMLLTNSKFIAALPVEN